MYLYVCVSVQIPIYVWALGPKDDVRGPPLSLSIYFFEAVSLYVPEALKATKFQQYSYLNLPWSWRSQVCTRPLA